MAKAARLLRDASQFNEYGLLGPGVELDFPRLVAKTQEVVYRIHEKKQLLGHLQESGIRVYTEAGNAFFVDAHTIQTERGIQLQGDAFILCSGGHSRRLDLPGEELALTHRDIWSLQSLPESLVIVGAAATGCQLATIFATFGARVLLLERAPRILRLEDEVVSNEIAASFTRQGVEIITGIDSVEKIEKLGSGLVVHFTHGGRQVEAQAAGVVLSSGWLGNVSSLHLEAAGVKHERSYVQVDEHLRTSVPHIFAAGDITGRMMLVQSAGYEARTAAENAVLGIGERNRHRIVPHGGFTNPEYGSVGFTEEQARAAGEYLAVSVPYANLDRAVIDDHPDGLCKLIVSPETHRILGAHIVGEQALETIQIVAAGMTAGLWVEELAEMELAYPTYAAILGLAARQAVRELGVVPVAPQFRTIEKPLPEWERSDDFANM
jgi:pyruvate/2-oxoglutarate dehydrogenase complex dihydrolipoamide dehydrogenase (E3) component